MDPDASDVPERVLDRYRIQVSLRQEPGDHRATAKASEIGAFTFDVLPPGDYILRARVHGVFEDTYLGEFAVDPDDIKR